MRDTPVEETLTVDPVQFVAAVERVWRARDGDKAAAGYTDDAVVYYGDGQTHSGDDLRAWPTRWFDYAKDLDIRKTYRAHSGNCIAGSWESSYTDPNTGKTIHERGGELFYLRGDKVCEHHMWQHSWTDGTKPSDQGFAV